MSNQSIDVMRQSLSLPDGSCNLRVGPGALDLVGRELRGIVGRPRIAALASSPDVDAALVEDVRRSLTDAGFRVEPVKVPPSRVSSDVSCLPDLCSELDRIGITADDALVAVGGMDLFPACSLVADVWCGGTTLVEVASDLGCASLCATTPGDLSVGGGHKMVGASRHPRLVICDLDRMELVEGEAPALARATFAAAAMCDSESSFSLLGLAATDIVSGDVNALRKQVTLCERSRAFMLNSTSVAVRQGISYGTELACALHDLPQLAGVPWSRLLGEGMRFSARISCGQGIAPVELVSDQDDLLASLGVPEV
ncbi:MAG: 3-dehydroquinate synthase, partial [Atopobiaceae bacterium]|nr:3-dehydroquinate synthase [Atopobiaceae bacterium]